MRLLTPGNAAPPLVSRYLLPDERQVATVRVHPAIIIGPMILVVAGLAVAGVLSNATHSNSTVILIIWLLWAILLLRAVWSFDQFFGYFVVTSTRMLIATGPVNRKIRSISFSKVDGVDLRRSAVGFALGYGELIVKATDQDETLPKVRFVPYPKEVYEQISREFKTFRSEPPLKREDVIDRILDPMLPSFDAPTLVELESSRVQRSASFEYIRDFLKDHITSAVGVAGVRGSGKTTLLRWIKYELEPDWIVLYLSTPAIYDAADFVRTIFANTTREVISKRSAVLYQGWLAYFSELFRPPNPDRQIVMLSQRALTSITGLRSDQSSISAGVSGRGVALQRGRRTTWTQRELSHPELVQAYKTYLEQYRRLGGLPIAIAIDELDKLASVDDAIAVVNGLKDLFHTPSIHFIVSVSEDARRRFAVRGIPFRDAFDSAFDTIVKVQPPSPGDALEILVRRAEGFPVSVALFCYAWSGALPRDLIRIARSCVTLARSAGEPVSVAALAPRIIMQDIADAIDNAIIKKLESGHTLGVDGLLALRHQISDQAIPLESVMDACKSEDPTGSDSANSMPEDNIMIQRLSVYMKIGSVMSEYFSDGITTLLSNDFDRVLDVVNELANAKAALAMYPPEAEWFLSRARAKMHLHLDREPHPGVCDRLLS